MKVIVERQTSSLFNNSNRNYRYDMVRAWKVWGGKKKEWKDETFLGCCVVSAGGHTLKSSCTTCKVLPLLTLLLVSWSHLIFSKIILSLFILWFVASTLPLYWAAIIFAKEPCPFSVSVRHRIDISSPFLNVPVEIWASIGLWSYGSANLMSDPLYFAISIHN